MNLIFGSRSGTGCPGRDVRDSRTGRSREGERWTGKEVSVNRRKVRGTPNVYTEIKGGFSLSTVCRTKRVFREKGGGSEM